jgi:hypothetical protein
MAGSPIALQPMTDPAQSRNLRTFASSASLKARQRRSIYARTKATVFTPDQSPDTTAEEDALLLQDSERSLLGEGEQEGDFDPGWKAETHITPPVGLVLPL